MQKSSYTKLQRKIIARIAFFSLVMASLVSALTMKSPINILLNILVFHVLAGIMNYQIAMEIPVPESFTGEDEFLGWIYNKIYLVICIFTGFIYLYQTAVYGME